MTRINCIPPEELTSLHLLAEYRELPRVFTLAAAANERWEGQEMLDCPDEYCLGSGHVKFFYNKLRYCWLRWLSLRDELIRRGYDCDPELKNDIAKTTAALSVTFHLWKDWEPSEYDKHINRIRIRERLDEYYNKTRKRVS